MRFERLKLFVILAAIFCARASAQSVPTLTSASPVYLRQGESREVELGGQNLFSAQSVALPDAKGVTASLDKSAKGNGPLHVKLAATADAALGDREMRIVTTTGVTQPLVVTVGQYTFIAEKEPNNSPEAAQTVALPACIGGRIDVAGDADFFRFAAKKGEHLLFDMHAARLGSPLEPVMTVHDGAGREMPHQEEYHGGDPMLVFDVSADGDYLLQVRDLQYRGGANFAYRIDAGALPYIESLSSLSGRPGTKVEVTAIGHNLAGAEKIMLDLAGAAPGPMSVRAKTALGVSNEAVFMVADAPSLAGEASLKLAVVPVPSEITGVLGHPNEEQSYKFRVTTRQQVTLGITARRIGSPVDALLTLKTANGDVIEQSNGAAEFEARITRALEPGEYLASVRDLTFAGGPSYAYRLSIGVISPPPEFSLRFMPDAIRVARGGHAKLWCEVTRANGFKGAVKLAAEGLPEGVTVGPAAIEEITSGVFTLAAAPDAPLGTFPIQIVAIGPRGLKRAGEAELNSRIVRQAYLTVTEAAPLTVETSGVLKPEQLTDYRRQVAEIEGRLKAPLPQLAAAQAAWEKQFDKPDAAPSAWKVLRPESTGSTGRAKFVKQPDGSIQTSGGSDRDTYTLTATSDEKKIVAIRLEALSDSSLPASGPGRAVNGNFVVNRFEVSAAPKSDPGKAQPIVFQRAIATFEQATFPAASATMPGTGGGWAIAPETGKSQAAVFFTDSPVAFEGGTILTFTLDQQFGSQHLLGRFRLSVSADANAKAEIDSAGPPGPILALLKIPADERTAAQKTKLANYYRSIAPELAGDRAKLETLRQTIGPYAQMAEMAASVRAAVPIIDKVLPWLVGSKKPELPVLFATARNKTILLPVPIIRVAGFKGDVQVTLEGFAAGRDLATRMPTAIGKNFVVTPLTLKGNESFGKLSVKVNPNSEVGTRMVVIRAETKVGNDTYVQYSQAFPLMVTEK
jgi:hypothetical protein